MASSPLHLAHLSPEDIVQELRARPLREARPPLSCGIAAIDEALPLGGLPSGVVVEIAAARGLSRCTTLALRACAEAQSKGRQAAGDGSSPWCAWVDPSGTLFAPGVASHGVDLERLLVVQPDPVDLARVAVRLTQEQLFSVVVIDRTALAGSSDAVGAARARPRWRTAIRRLALAAEQGETSVLLLSPLHVAHRDLLPVAMRVELTRPERNALRLQVTKDRRGFAPRPADIPMASLLPAAS